MNILRPGDVLLYEVTTREKGTLTHYYGCEVVGSITGGRPLNRSGEPVTGVIAVYRLKNVAIAVEPGRILLARHENGPDEMNRLSRELEKIYGPGELFTGFPCQCEAACGMLKKRLL